MYLKIKNTLIHLLLAIGLCSVYACLSEIPLETVPGIRSSVAIRGAVVLSESSHVLVKVTNVNEFRASDIPELITDAQVVLVIDNGDRVPIPHRELGQYYLDLSPNDISRLPEAGRSYYLEVTLPDGRQYRSSPEILHPAKPPTRISQRNETRTILNAVGNTVEQEFLRFYVDTPLFDSELSEGSYLKWSFKGTYRITESTLDVPLPPVVKTCYLEEDLNLEGVVLFNGTTVRRPQLTDFFLIEEPYDYRFYEGYYLTVRQQSLSQKAYEHWEQISDVVNRTGNFFEAPAGKVTGNLYRVDQPSEEVFGYFYATEEAIVHYRVTPGQSKIRRLCPFLAQPEDRSVNYLCFECLAHPRSSLEKPDYWED